MSNYIYPAIKTQSSFDMYVQLLKIAQYMPLQAGKASTWHEVLLTDPYFLLAHIYASPIGADILWDILDEYVVRCQRMEDSYKQALAPFIQWLYTKCQHFAQAWHLLPIEVQLKYNGLKRVFREDIHAAPLSLSEELFVIKQKARTYWHVLKKQQIAQPIHTSVLSAFIEQIQQVNKLHNSYAKKHLALYTEAIALPSKRACELALYTRLVLQSKQTSLTLPNTFTLTHHSANARHTLTLQEAYEVSFHQVMAITCFSHIQTKRTAAITQQQIWINSLFDRNTDQVNTQKKRLDYVAFSVQDTAWTQFVGPCDISLTLQLSSRSKSHINAQLEAYSQYLNLSIDSLLIQFLTAHTQVLFNNEASFLPLSHMTGKYTPKEGVLCWQAHIDQADQWQGCLQVRIKPPHAAFDIYALLAHTEAESLTLEVIECKVPVQIQMYPEQPQTLPIFPFVTHNQPHFFVTLPKRAADEIAESKLCLSWDNLPDSIGTYFEAQHITTVDFTGHITPVEHGDGTQPLLFFPHTASGTYTQITKLNPNIRRHRQLKCVLTQPSSHFGHQIYEDHLQKLPTNIQQGILDAPPQPLEPLLKEATLSQKYTFSYTLHTGKVNPTLTWCHYINTTEEYFHHTPQTLFPSFNGSHTWRIHFEIAPHTRALLLFFTLKFTPFSPPLSTAPLILYKTKAQTWKHLPEEARIKDSTQNFHQSGFLHLALPKDALPTKDFFLQIQFSTTEAQCPTLEALHTQVVPFHIAIPEGPTETFISNEALQQPGSIIKGLKRITLLTPHTQYATATAVLHPLTQSIPQLWVSPIDFETVLVQHFDFLRTCISFTQYKKQQVHWQLILIGTGQPRYFLSPPQHTQIIHFLRQYVPKQTQIECRHPHFVEVQLYIQLQVEHSSRQHVEAALRTMLDQKIMPWHTHKNQSVRPNNLPTKRDLEQLLYTHPAVTFAEIHQMHMLNPPIATFPAKYIIYVHSPHTKFFYEKSAEITQKQLGVNSFVNGPVQKPPTSSKNTYFITL